MAFIAEWTVEIAAKVVSLDAPDLRERDLREANMVGAFLVGADLKGAQMQGANLRGAQMQGANLVLAQMQGANLRGAQMQGANLGSAQMQGADLGSAQMQGANLRGAQMQGANLGSAQMQGANLRGAQMQNVNWAWVINDASPAHFTDLSGARDLNQALLDGWIGNNRTVLPDGTAPDTGEAYYIWSCWKTPPVGFEDMLETASDSAEHKEELRAEWLCPEGEEPQKIVARGVE